MGACRANGNSSAKRVVKEAKLCQLYLLGIIFTKWRFSENLFFNLNHSLLANGTHSVKGPKAEKKV